MRPSEATRPTPSTDRPLARAAWVVLPLVLVAALVGGVGKWGPAGLGGPAEVPPLERLVFERVALGPDGLTAVVVNDGPAPLTIAQVMVDEAYWSFEARPGPTLSHLGRATLVLPYPWVLGEAHAIRVVTATGATFDHEIPLAAPTPRPDLRFFATFALVGLYVGVLPVGLGLLWFPVVARLGARGLHFVLALTVGLLVFLLVDATREGLESAGAVADSYQPVALFVFAGLGAALALERLSRWLRARRRGTREAGEASGRLLALLVAIGIGWHNFAEGLAIGSAYAVGAVALGALLIVGFTLHNTTEGVAIVAPLARARPTLGTLLGLGLIGGAPTIGGAWLGGLAYSPVIAVLCLGVGAGAIAQVAHQILRQMAGDRGLVVSLADGPVAAGISAGVVVMYLTGLLVG